VHLADETYLEPLAIGQREDCEHTAMKGNQFTARDQAYRFRNGETGFSAIALKSDDADADHVAFQKAGISAGRKLVFGRSFADDKGKKVQATFKLAFAADLRAPDMFAFTCQRVKMPGAIARATGHPNTVTGTHEVILSEVNPTDFQYFLQDVTGNRETHAHSLGMSIRMANAECDVMTPEGLALRFGVTRQDTSRGLRCEGIVFSCTDLDAVRHQADKSGIGLRERGGMVIADAAPGQGAFYAFRTINGDAS
jgi:hypothetical protein